MTAGFLVASSDAGTVTLYGVHDARLETRGVVEVGAGVSSLALSGAGVLHAATRAEVVTLTTGGLTVLSRRPIDTPLAYLSVTDRQLFGASYRDGSVLSFGLDGDGAPTGTAAVRTLGRNAHCILPGRSGQDLWVAVLGDDVVWRIPVGADGSFDPVAGIAIPVPAASGPRHLAFVPGRDELVVWGERSATLTALSVPGGEVVASWPGLPDGLGLAPGIVRSMGDDNPDTDAAGRPLTWAADIAVTPDGTVVYCTERRTSTLSAVSVADRRVLGAVTTERQPRGVGLDATGRLLLATGELSGTVSLYEVDGGRIDLLDRATVGAGALWVEPVTLPA